MSTFDEHERGLDGNGSAGQDADVERLERDAAGTRADLADTVDALTAKLDVKSRAKHGADAQLARAQHAVADVRRTATDRDGRPLPQVWVAGGVALAVVVGVPLLVRALRSRTRSTRSVRFAR